MASKVFIETHGCQMNVADTERAISRLRSNGFEISSSSGEADVVILNTCSIRARAEAKLSNRIGQIKHAGVKPSALFGVMGCIAQLEGENLFSKHPDVDFIVGTGAVDRIPAVVNKSLNGQVQSHDLLGSTVGSHWDLAPSERHQKASVFVPIIEGCNKFCSYCIVPFARGRESSRTASEIVAEVKALYQAGFNEVQLIGQNVNSYRPKSDVRLEAYKGATPFVKLLRAVSATGIPRIKFTTSFPRDFHPEIVEVIDTHENLCNWVHLPVQSGSDAILKAMRRGYKATDFLEKVAAIHNSSRSIALTTDIIIGFPGETESDFTSTLNLVRQSKFHGMYIFKYSQRAGTRAALLADDIPPDVKKRRFQEIEEVQLEIQKDIYKSYIGKTLEVLVEGRSSRHQGDAVGHSTCHKVINFAAPNDMTGQIVNVLVTEANPNSLYGKIVS